MDCGCEVIYFHDEDDVVYCSLHAAAPVMLAAHKAIFSALTTAGGWWELRKFLNDHDIYNDDLSDNRVIEAASRYAIAQAEPNEVKTQP